MIEIYQLFCLFLANEQACIVSINLYTKQVTTDCVDNVSALLTQNVMAMMAPVAKPLVMYICCLQKLTTYTMKER